MRNDEIDTDSGKDEDITTPPTKGVFQSVKMKKLMSSGLKVDQDEAERANETDPSNANMKAWNRDYTQ